MFYLTNILSLQRLRLATLFEVIEKSYKVKRNKSEYLFICIYRSSVQFILNLSVNESYVRVNEALLQSGEFCSFLDFKPD